MDQVMVTALAIAGGLSSLLILLIQQVVILRGWKAQGIILAVSVGIAVYAAAQAGVIHNLGDVAKNLVVIYGASQAVYNLLISKLPDRAKKVLG